MADQNQNGVTGKRIAGLLSLISLSALVACLLIMMWVPVPEVNKEYFTVALMGLVSLTSGSFGYYFGSSDDNKPTVPAAIKEE